MKDLRIYIATRGGADHGVGQVVTKQRGGEGDGTAGFKDDAQMGEGKGDGVQGLIIGHHKAGTAEAAQDREGDLAGGGRDDGIAD